MPTKISIRDRVKELRRVLASELIPNAKNWRRHPAKQQKAMRAVLGEIGYADALLAREDENGKLILIDGHLRAGTTPESIVPVLVLDVTEAEGDKILATLDPLANMADIDTEAWSSLIEGLDAEMPDFQDLLDGLNPKHKLGLTDEDEIPPVPETPITKPGDLWILGDHRLLCGDSTKPDDVARLMNSETAALMATDPPYLINYQGGDHPESWASRGRKTKDKHWDDYHDADQSSDFFASFISAALPHLAPYFAFYQWHAGLRSGLVLDAWARTGMHVHQQIIWVKTRPVLTRCHLMWKHEAAFYGWAEGKGPKLKPPSNETTVWEVSQAGEQDGIHPTQKPVELFRRPLLWHLEPGGLAFEPFSGSGTQLIAAETVQRRCYAIELEPRFVDCAISRWQSFTGKTAFLQSSGERFHAKAN